MTQTKYFEHDYVKLLKDILDNGTFKKTRNANTYSLFGKTLKIDMRDTKHFPMIQGRQIFYKGVLGEFAAMLRGPTCVEDFKKWGCNYWGQWADEDGKLRLDYGNTWKNFNGVDQIEAVRKALRENPNDRRMIISGWRPEKLVDLSLPCCHMLYQWRVNGQHLDMIWYQRSVDMMVGMPSDIILAALWNIMLANEVGLKPGEITFMLGDTHIYEEHLQMCDSYITNFEMDEEREPTTYELNVPIGQDLETFEPDDITIKYRPGPRIILPVIS